MTGAPIATSFRKPLPDVTAPMQTDRVIGLAAGHFINDMYVGFLPALLPLIIRKTGISLAMAAGLSSLLSIFTSMAQPVFGHVADSSRRPYLAVFGPLLTALFFSAIGWANNYLALAAVIIIGGCGSAAFHPQGAALAGRSAGRQSGLAMSMFVTGGGAGYYIGPVIIMAIVTWLGLEYSFVAVGPGFLITIILFLLLPRLPHTPRQHARMNGFVSATHPWRAMMLLFLISSIRAFVISGFNTFIPIYLESQHVAPMLYAAGLTAFGLPGAAGAMLSGGLSDRFGRRTIIFASVAIALPFLALFVFLHGFMAIVCLAIGGFAISASIPVVIVMAQELFPGRVNMASSLVMGLSWGIGGLLVTPLGFLADLTGITSALNALILFGAVSCLPVFFLPETKRGGR